MSMHGAMREIKVCLLGDSGVGKSSLLLRFVNDRFDPNSTATIGASFMSKTFSFGEQSFRYQIWDTAGQERYKALAPMYYRGSHAAIFVYDITVENTFESLKRWVKELRQYGPSNVILAVAGNKCDLLDGREVDKSVGEAYAKSINAVFVEVSALTAHNVNEMFLEISKRLPPEENAGYYDPHTGFKMGQKQVIVEEKKCCD